MKHYCPMCGEQWNEDVCGSCGWYEGKPTRDIGRNARRGVGRAYHPKLTNQGHQKEHSHHDDQLSPLSPLRGFPDRGPDRRAGGAMSKYLEDERYVAERTERMWREAWREVGRRLKALRAQQQRDRASVRAPALTTKAETPQP